MTQESSLDSELKIERETMRDFALPNEYAMQYTNSMLECIANGSWLIDTTKLWFIYMEKMFLFDFLMYT